MDKVFIEDLASRFIFENPENIISDPSYNKTGVKIWNNPLFGYADADDYIFSMFKNERVVTEKYLLPGEWLPGAKTVISFFLPYTDEVRISNRAGDEPSFEWLYGRIEGHKFLIKLCNEIAESLRSAGFKAEIPSISDRFAFYRDPNAIQQFASNWSERHTAFACGIGTFSLSKSIITEKGSAGRLGSIITDAVFEPTIRTYEEIYENCSKCGVCVDRCPVGAISLETGKSHPPCSEYNDKMGQKYAPRYGCAKCQCGCPCESGIPT